MTALRPVLATCSNCGEVRLCVARHDRGQMCLPCWRAEWAYMRAHFTADEIDHTHRAAVLAAFDAPAPAWNDWPALGRYIAAVQAKADAATPDATPDEARAILAELAAALDQPAPPIADLPFSLTATVPRPPVGRTGGLFDQEADPMPEQRPTVNLKLYSLYIREAGSTGDLVTLYDTDAARVEALRSFVRTFREALVELFDRGELLEACDEAGHTVSLDEPLIVLDVWRCAFVFDGSGHPLAQARQLREIAAALDMRAGQIVSDHEAGI